MTRSYFGALSVLCIGKRAEGVFADVPVYRLNELMIPLEFVFPVFEGRASADESCEEVSRGSVQFVAVVGYMPSLV